jgi:hypothetical protein
MQAFFWTPQAMMMGRITKDLATKRTFDKEYLASCQFEVGDRVNGVDVVSERSDEKAVLNLGAPVRLAGADCHRIFGCGFGMS